MKRGCPRHRKTEDLAEAMNLEVWQAVGLLEMLFHLAQEQHQRGDIGARSNKSICAWIGWKGDPDQFINTLIRIGWLDECPVHRLLVHDWKEHADGVVKKWLQRNGVSFAEKGVAVSDQSVTSQRPAPMPTLPCLTLPCPTLPNLPVEVVADRKKPEEIKTAGDILDESLHREIDRTGMIHTLASECGFTSGRAIQLAGDPWLTPERLRYIIDLAAKQCGKNGIQGYVVAGIKGHYEPDPTKGKIPKVAEYKPPFMGAYPS